MSENRNSSENIAENVKKAAQNAGKKSKILNAPNILTMFRVVMIIPFVILLLNAENGTFGENQLIPCIVAAGIFLLACITDFIDGKIARGCNLVTNFGKFMDPLADKILVSSGMICLVAIGRIPAWVVVVILAREFIISGFRLVASDANIVIAASYWGKFKTTFQMAMVIMMIVDLSPFWAPYAIITDVVMYIALALTIISMVDYIVKNRKVLAQ